MNADGFVVGFIVAINVLTLIEMLYYRRGKERGEVYYPWLFPVCALFYLGVNIASVYEYSLLKRPLSLSVTGTGIGMMLLRFTLKYWTATSLSKFWGLHIEIRPQHELVMSGPYRLVRHPGYVTTVLEMLTIPLVLNAYVTFAVTLIGYAGLVFIRIVLEEKVLSLHFGGTFERYRNETDAVFPFKRIFSRSRDVVRGAKT